MIDDGYIPTLDERIAYREGLITLSRFDPTAPIQGVNPDGSPRELSAIERFTNDLFANTASRVRVHGVGSFVTRELMPIDLEGGWVQQSLSVDNEGRATQVVNCYMGDYPWKVNSDYLFSNGSLWTRQDGLLCFRNYGSNVVNILGIPARAKLLTAIKQSSKGKY